MEIPEPIDEGLPAPRDDEPEALRDDIVAELNDHLQCALLRERHRCANTESAWQAVVKRFGNPREVARRLWWDNMKEQIMRGRITISLMALAVVACFAAVGVSWMALSQLQASNDQKQQANLALLAKLEELRSERPSEPTAGDSQPVSEWTTLRVRLVKAKPSDYVQKDAAGNAEESVSASDDEEREPASGIKVYLGGNLNNSKETFSLSETSDQDGWVKFGPIQVGMYTISGQNSWGYEFSRRVVLLPAEEHVKTIPCPWPEPQKAPVRIEVDWPKDLRDTGASLCCYINPSNLNYLNHVTWNHFYPQRVAIDSHNQFLFNPNNNSHFSTIVLSEQQFQFPSLNSTKYIFRSGSSWLRRALDNDQVQVIKTAKLWVGEYDLLEFVVSMPTGGVGRYEWKQIGMPGPVHFSAKAGEETVWKIKLPESVVVSLREKFGTVSAEEQTKLKEKYQKEILEKLHESLADIPGVQIDVPMDGMKLEYNGDTSADAPVMLLTSVRPKIVIPELSLEELAKSKLPDVEEPSKEQLDEATELAYSEVNSLVAESLPKSAEPDKSFSLYVETEQERQLTKKIEEALKDIPNVEIRWFQAWQKDESGVARLDLMPIIIIPEKSVFNNWRKTQREKTGKEPEPPTAAGYRTILRSHILDTRKKVIELLPVVGDIDDRRGKVQIRIVDDRGVSIYDYPGDFK